MYKKIIAFIFAFTILCSSVPFAVAADTPTVKVSSATAEPGETVTLSVSLENNPGINTFSFKFDYDTSKVNLINVELNPSVGGQFVYTKKASWISTTNVTTDGEYLTLIFAVPDSATAGDTAVTVKYEPGDIANLKEEMLISRLLPVKLP